MAEEEKVVVLRDLSRARAGGGAVFGGGPKVGTSWATPAEIGGAQEVDPAVSVESADRKQVDEIRRDPTVVGFANSMPLSLIEPSTEDEDDGAEATVSGTNVTWGIDAIGADNSTYTGKNVTVAVLDTGIDRDHPAFNVADLRLITQDFTGTGDDDTHGHGTHCAGTIFGRDVDGTRIGVARGVRRAIIGKVIGGNAGTDVLIRAMEWATSNGAQVISMSLGFDFVRYRDYLVSRGVPGSAATSTALQTYRDNIRLFDEWMALNAAREHMTGGCVVVAAAGNESGRNSRPPYEVNASSPSAANDVVSVAALMRGSQGLQVAPFSNTGAKIAAPGVNVLSAKAGGGLTAMNGTSMACPHVAGLAALYLDQLIDSPIKPTASATINRLMAHARFGNVFDPNIDMSDVGAGLSVAP